MQKENEAYYKVCKEELLKKTDNEEVLNKLEEEAAKYWSDSRKEATSLLNLYNYEYSTALDRNLNNIDEELEQSIPKNKRYLLRDCGEDYERMLDVLQKSWLL